MREIPVFGEMNYIPNYPIELMPVIVFYKEDSIKYSIDSCAFTFYHTKYWFNRDRGYNFISFSYIGEEKSNKFDSWHYDKRILDEDYIMRYFNEMLQKFPTAIYTDNHFDLEKTRSYWEQEIEKALEKRNLFIKNNV